MKTIHFSLWQGLFLLLAAIFLTSLANAANASVGQFQFVTGEVRIESAEGRERLAQKGGDIHEGESIVSAKGASAQLRMIDGGIVAIRQDTRMRIDEYKFSGREDGSERSFFSLVKGGFRSITGTVGKRNKDNYRITTPSATIGIRGTDSETIHITDSGERPDIPAGTYNRVNTGATIVNGTLVNPNQVAYAPNLSTPAVILPQMPPIFEQPRAPQIAKTAAPTSGSSATTSETPPPPDAQASALASTTLPPPPAPTTALVGSSATSGGILSSSGTYAAPIGYGGVGTDISWRTECPVAGSCYTGWLGGAGSMVIEANSNRTILLNSSGFPVLIAETTTGGGMQYTAGTATLLDFGQSSAAGTTVRWGRYVGADSFVDNSGTRDPLVMNLMWADSALSYVQAQNVLSGTNTLNFNLVSAAGTVTDELNNVYHLVNGNLQVFAGGSGMTLHVTTDTVANRSWDLIYQSTVGALSQFYQATNSTGPSGLPLVNGSIKVNGTIVPTSIKGQASGVFIGGTATGALTSFTANALPGTGLPSGASLSGTALLVR